MREANWKEILFSKGVDGIVDLIARYNAGLTPLTARQKAMLRVKVQKILDKGGVAGLSNYVADKYNGVLYEPDIFRPDERELLDRKIRAVKIDNRKTVIHKTVNYNTYLVRDRHNIYDSAENDLYCREYVQNVYRHDDSIIVLVEGQDALDRVNRRIAKYYKGLNIQVLDKGGK